MAEHSNETIAEWLSRISEHEGVFSDSTVDPGNWTGGAVGVGELKGTKHGISAGSYPDLDIKNLTMAEVVDIYQRDFIRPLKLGRYRDGVAFQILDFGINSGPDRAIKTIQKEIGVIADGIVGPITLAALSSRSESDIIMLTLAGRLEFLSRLKNWPSESRGWVRRIAKNLRHGATDS